MRRLRLSTVLILINLVILLLPLGGIAVLRIYESALVRQTESELIAQGVFVAATYRALFARQPVTPRARAGYGLPVTAPPRAVGPDTRWRPLYPVLDLADDPILPRPPELDPVAEPDPLALAVGRELAPILRDSYGENLAGIRVTDFHGVVVASTFEDDTHHSLAELEEVQHALTGASASRLRWRSSDSPAPPLDSISRGSRIRVYLGMPIVHGERVLGAVLLQRTPANIRQALWGKRRELAQGGLALLAVVIAIALITSFTINRPVQALIRQARRAARGEQGAVAPLPHPGTREIAELSETVAAMAGTLEARADYIRDFAAQVSHEFKTPLTAMQGAAELLREHSAGMSREELQRFVGILQSDAQRLEKLVRRLLDLARADMTRASGETCDAVAVAEGAAARFRESGLPVQVRAPNGPLAVRISAEILESVLSNLLENSRSHGGPGAGAEIRVERDDAVGIAVTDTGAGISPANRERIFQPFFTTARERGGTGLGLAIVRSLLRAHGGEIALAPSAQGASFRISLPAV